MAHPPPDFRHLPPFDFGPHLLGAFPPSHRQQCGPSGPDRPPTPGLSPLHSDSNQRSSFWERSHNALDRFRHRAVPPGGRDDWSRGMWDEDAGANLRSPSERYGPGELHSNKKESPPRKQKPPSRIQVRKPAHTYGVAKPPENCVDESFEDLLSKDQPPPDTPASVVAPRTEAAVPTSIQSPSTTEEASNAQRTEKKVFQAFNIKPLRQKLLTPQELDAQKKKLEEENGGGQEAEPDQAQQPGVPGRLEEEDLSEMQLRLLALQSASKKWQQKEQEVMKESKERNTTTTKAAQDKSSGMIPGNASPGRPRVTTRSASTAAAAERARTRVMPLERARERARVAATRPAARTPGRPAAKPAGRPAARPAVRDRGRASLVERERAKPGSKLAAERGRTPGKPPSARKMISPGGSS
ncbi:hypothetical protein CRUP_030358 [Coryphaenoides rupestris]|nr:hypothetical protein CRUP_030358 [Coryphaenoides rupestris]